MVSGTDILLIEDEPNIAEAVRFILTRDGWRLDHWSEGGQALARITQLRPRLVILDVMLPAQSGLEVLAALRAHPDIAATPVLMLTARGSTGRGAITAEGADRVMAKPFDNDDLRRAVSEMLGQPA
ncbi:response regulator transcription factor [Paracoccus xiamenensis]|uniref:response regulator transcription factor n=1 Tax=Paracoccus xiamenensis TaxID=2714901 RepID=UPI00140E4F09|nr:response regulator [Paracoccus xiamenensis]NHF74273.1 response regulator [Paracoccus xiamenensis]